MIDYDSSTMAMLFEARTLNKIMRWSFAPKAGNQDFLRGVERNLLVHLVAQIPFHCSAYLAKQILHASANHVKQLPYAPYIMHFLIKYTRIHYVCKTRHDMFVPDDEVPVK